MNTRPDANVLPGLPTAFSMPGQMREKARAVDMQPRQFTCDAHAGFIPMLQRTGAQPVGNVRHYWGQSLGCALAPGEHGSF